MFGMTACKITMLCILGLPYVTSFGTFRVPTLVGKKVRSSLKVVMAPELRTSSGDRIPRKDAARIHQLKGMSFHLIVQLISKTKITMINMIQRMEQFALAVLTMLMMMMPVTAAAMGGGSYSGAQRTQTQTGFVKMTRGDIMKQVTRRSRFSSSKSRGCIELLKGCVWYNFLLVVSANLIGSILLPLTQVKMIMMLVQDSEQKIDWI